MIEQGHPRPSSREVLFDFEVPLGTVPFRKPGSKACLLFDRQGLYRLLKLDQAHTRILPRLRTGGNPHASGPRLENQLGSRGQ